MTLSNQRIGILCGGISRERDISLISGNNVLESLTRQGFNASLIDPFLDSDWMSKLDIAFLALHGEFGEDGGIQALLDTAGIPYTGSGVAASTIGMNKLLTKQLCTRHNIPTPNYEVCQTPLDHCPDTFSYPVIVKPISEGSSINVFLCHSDEELQTHTRHLLNIYPHFLLESFIDGPEITIGVLDYPTLTAFPILELRSQNEFYDYDAKYTAGKTEFILPADLPDSLTKHCQTLAKSLYSHVQCRGAARVDMRIDGHQRPYVLEMNTLPGLTPLSDLPAQAKHAGMSYDELILNIIHSALQRTAVAQ